VKGADIPSSEAGIMKQLWRAVPDGRTAGRPKLRCLHCIENDLKSKGFEKWMKKVKDRLAWAIMLKEALVNQEGPYADEEHGTYISHHFQIPIIAEEDS
jgi:hypothetical protein